MKKISSIEGVIKTLEAIKDISLGGEPQDRNNALREKLKIRNSTIIVDTVVAFDTGNWETGIEIDGNHWIIVEQYENNKKAKEGHNKWVRNMKENPKRKLVDCNVWGDFD